nr:MAG TPA: hypothetical protein [Caudoviricetes sp.]
MDERSAGATCAALAGNLKISRTTPTPKKFSAAGRLTAVGLPCEIFSQ